MIEIAEQRARLEKVREGEAMTQAGGLTVDRRRVAGGLWEYRVAPSRKVVLRAIEERIDGKN